MHVGWHELGQVRPVTDDLTFEATALRLADGDGCASLLRDDFDRGALLLERLGAAICDVVPDPATRYDMMCDVAVRLWRPVSPDVDLPTGADKAREYSDLLPRLWEETGRACSEATVEDALACLDRRRRAHDDRHAAILGSKLEARLPIPRHVDLDLADIGQNRLGPHPVAGVVRPATDRIVLVIAK